MQKKINYNPNTDTCLSQNTRILEALEGGAVLTPLMALGMFGTMKLSTRISELIRKGHPISKKWVITPTGKKVMSYRMGKR